MKRRNLLAYGASLLAGSTLTQLQRAMADEPAYFPLIVRGGNPPLNATYNAEHELVVTFVKNESAAGDRGRYEHLAHGSAAWLDRPLADDEPRELRQKMSREKAAEIITKLATPRHFVKFMCSNPGNGFFAVSDSEFVPGREEK